MAGRTRSERIAFRYLYGFRRTIPPLAAASSLIAWLADWPALATGLLCIAVGELLETSYYIGVLRWAERTRSQLPTSLETCTSSSKPIA